MKASSLTLLIAAVVLFGSTAEANTPFLTTKAPVDVTLFVMSRCPDAFKCEATFADVFKSESLPAINPSLSFIGSIDQHTSSHWSTTPSIQNNSLTLTTTKTVTTTVTCKHGPLECAGNEQQLCFRNQFLSDWRTWYPFVIGMNSWEPRRIGEEGYALQIAERVLKNNEKDDEGNNGGEIKIWGTTAEDWASLEYDESVSSIEQILGADADPELGDDRGDLGVILRKFQQCFQGPEGFELLVQSVQHTIDNGVG
ncbi:hypothetical protein BGZ83_001471 [Gryganskiella cystojenkinii]|nr:hypothetical protein BGZ83_001471 [Gryganskiella cystojenkinii]